MSWSAQSPDLNPIENVGKTIGQGAQLKNFINQDELWKFMKEEWQSISPSFCEKLIDTCGRRSNDVIKNEVLFTKY